MKIEKIIAETIKVINDPNYKVCGSCEWSFWPFTVKKTIIVTRGKEAIMCLSYSTSVFRDKMARQAIDTIASTTNVRDMMGVGITDDLINAAKGVALEAEIARNFGVTKEEYLKSLADPERKLVRKDKVIIKKMEELNEQEREEKGEEGSR